jgi:hypothetical protein
MKGTGLWLDYFCKVYDVYEGSALEAFCQPWKAFWTL